MAETLISPGVLARENDQSFVTSPPLTPGAAIIGPTVKGPVERPTYISSFSSFQAIFGGSLESGSTDYTYLTSIAANNYFQQGGESLLVTRVTSGSFTSATSSLIPTGSGGPQSGLSPFVLETISEGEIMNSGDAELTRGALVSGSADNVRWEITSVNTGSGVFSLAIRRGNDNNNQKVFLETYNNISLDPFAPNYISRAIGDLSTTVVTEGADTFLQESGSYPNISSYVRVKQVNYNTPHYFDNDGNAKDQFTGSLPSVSSGSFGGAIGSNIPVGRAANFYQNINATDTQGLVGSDYTNAIALLANQDDYQYNVIATPGLTLQDAATQVNAVKNNTISRGDAIYVMDLVRYNTPISTVTNQASGPDSSYAAAYWPWVQTIDPNTGLAQAYRVPTGVPSNTGVVSVTDRGALVICQ